MLAKHLDLLLDPNLNPELTLLLSMLDDATKDWRRYLGEIEQDVITWQVAPGSYSIGGILLHMADCEVHWMENVAAGQEPEQYDPVLDLARQADQYLGQWPTPPHEPLSYFYAVCDKVREQTHKIVIDLGQPDKIGYRDDDSFSLRWILNHVIAHESYSGGQIVMLSELHKHLA